MPHVVEMNVEIDAIEIPNWVIAIEMLNIKNNK